MRINTILIFVRCIQWIFWPHEDIRIPQLVEIYIRWQFITSLSYEELDPGKCFHTFQTRGSMSFYCDRMLLLDKCKFNMQRLEVVFWSLAAKHSAFLWPRWQQLCQFYSGLDWLASRCEWAGRSCKKRGRHWVENAVNKKRKRKKIPWLLVFMV